MSWRQVLRIIAACAGSAALAGTTPGRTLIVGTWSSGATGEYDLMLNVTATEVTFGACTGAYVVLREERSAHRASAFSHPGTWTYVAIQLRPDRAKLECREQPEVLEFAIPDDMICHSELMRYLTMEDFRKSYAYIESLSWGNEDCTSHQAPNKSLERTRGR